MRPSSLLSWMKPPRASSSERKGRISDAEDGGSLEQKKQEGYF